MKVLIRLRLGAESRGGAACHSLPGTRELARLNGEASEVMFVHRLARMDKRATVAEDKAYDTKDHVAALRNFHMEILSGQKQSHNL